MATNLVLAALAALALQAVGEPRPETPMAGLTVTGQSAGAAEALEPAQVADSVANRKSERVVCRDESKANSRFTRKVCRKQKDWIATADQAQDDFGKVQGRTMASTIPGN